MDTTNGIHPQSVEELPWELIRLVMMSVANVAIFPMQDILGLGEEARMNHPPLWRATGNGGFYRIC